MRGRAALCALLLSAAVPVQAADPPRDPTLGHGFGEVVRGVVFELPKTVLDATFNGPPIAGTLVGIVAGAARAVQRTVAGVVEMGRAFDPWGLK